MVVDGVHPVECLQANAFITLRQEVTVMLSADMRPIPLALTARTPPCPAPCFYLADLFTRGPLRGDPPLRADRVARGARAGVPGVLTPGLPAGAGRRADGGWV